MLTYYNVLLIILKKKKITQKKISSHLLFTFLQTITNRVGREMFPLLKWAHASLRR